MGKTFEEMAEESFHHAKDLATDFVNLSMRFKDKEWAEVTGIHFTALAMIIAGFYTSIADQKTPERADIWLQMMLRSAQAISKDHAHQVPAVQIVKRT